MIEPNAGTTGRGDVTVLQTPAPGFRFLGHWVIASALGGAVTYPTLLLLAALGLEVLSLGLTSAFVWFAAPLTGVIAGSVMGLSQWLALRKVYPGTHAWLLATILAWICGLVVAVGLFFWLLPEGLGYMILLAPVLFGGAVSGLVQALLVRRWVGGLHWWVLANASGWVLGWVVGLGLAAYSLRGLSLPPGTVVASVGAIHGLWIGFQSGIALLLLSMNVPLSEVPDADFQRRSKNE